MQIFPRFSRSSTPDTSVQSDGVNRYSAPLFSFVTDNGHLYASIAFLEFAGMDEKINNKGAIIIDAK